MGRPPSAGLVRPKNDSMARAGPWWPMAVLDLRVGLAGKPPPALYCPSVDRLGIEAHFPAASRDRPSCRDHVAGGLALEFVGVPGGRIGHVCCLSSSRCILDDLPSGMRVRNDGTGPCPAAPGGCGAGGAPKLRSGALYWSALRILLKLSLRPWPSKS